MRSAALCSVAEPRLPVAIRFVAFIGVDDVGDQSMADDVAAVELREVDIVDARKDFGCRP